MAEINKYGMYNMSFSNSGMGEKDKIDKWVEELTKTDSLDAVRSFVSSNFGNIEGENWFDYPDLNKKVYVLVDEEKVEVCALKNDKQYFGKGWKLIKEDEYKKPE